jgi:hypothetical protein
MTMSYYAPGLLIPPLPPVPPHPLPPTAVLIQNAGNVWRKRAFRVLLEGYTDQ